LIHFYKSFRIQNCPSDISCSMSRLSSVGTMSIQDRIKAFDSSQSKGGSKASSPAPPARLSMSVSGPTSVPNSPLSKTSTGKSQFSAKDPTRPGQVQPVRSSSRHSLSNSPASKPTSPPPLSITKTESKSVFSRSEKTTKTEIITNNGNVPRTPTTPSTNNSNSAIKTRTSITNGSGPGSHAKINNVDTPDRASSKHNILEVFQERNVPEKMSVQDNNNINMMKSITNNGSVTPSERSQDSLNSEELPSFSSSIDEMELRDLRRVRREMDMRLVDREDQVEELATQVERLLGVKSRLETEMSQIKKEHKREVADKEDELEDTRASAAKRIKNLEQQLEAEHEERLSFVRERHDLEGKIMTLKDAIDHGNSEEEVRKLKKDLKRSKALLKDAQLMVEKSNHDGMNKIILRQLKTQLEDAEFARTAALKARGNIELELVETNSMLEDSSRAKTDLEEKVVKVGRERADLAQQVRENEEEMMELMKKYKAAVSACSTDQITIQDQALTIQQLETERNRAQELLAEMEVKLDHFKGEQVSIAQHRRLELKLREMESKLELEQTSKGRLETQVGRLKEVIDGLNKDNESLRTREKSGQTELKKLSKTLRDTKETLAGFQGRDSEFSQKKMDFEKQVELAEAETISVRNELKIAQRRIEDLQAAIQGDMDTSVGESEEEDDEDEGMWIEAAKKRIMSSQASSLYNMTDNTDKSLSNISVNSTDRESLDLAT